MTPPITRRAGINRLQGKGKEDFKGKGKGKGKGKLQMSIENAENTDVPLNSLEEQTPRKRKSTLEVPQDDAVMAPSIGINKGEASKCKAKRVYNTDTPFDCDEEIKYWESKTRAELEECRDELLKGIQFVMAELQKQDAALSRLKKRFTDNTGHCCGSGRSSR